MSLKWKSLVYSVLFCLRLPRIDWSDETKQRIILASLVKGVYSLEHERQGTFHQGGEKAESRWTKYGFKLHGSPLVDKYDGSYYGAIFKNKYPYQTKSGPIPPKYVIAFRGTLFTPKTAIQDLSLDRQFICHKLHKSTRVKDALDNVLNIIDQAGGPQNEWLAGHSLGSAISLAVGRELVLKYGFILEAFLFNPPIVSSPFKLSRYVGLCTKSFITSLLEYVVVEESSGTSLDIAERFNKLSPWMPHLFIHPDDLICKGYASYFEQREKMGAAANQCSVISLIAEAVGRD